MKYLIGDGKSFISMDERMNIALKSQSEAILHTLIEVKHLKTYYEKKLKKPLKIIPVYENK